MSFQWEFEDPDQPERSPPTPGPHGRGWWWPLLLLLGLAVGIGLVWWWATEQITTAEGQEQSELQQAFDDTAVAILADEHPLNWPVLADPNLDWRVAQWQPLNRAFWQAKPTITSSTQPDPASPTRWLNLGWSASDGTPRQRLAFAEQVGDRFYMQADDAAFWGADLRASYAWGVLRFAEADEPLHTAVGNFVRDLCAAQVCPPLTVTLAPDYAPSATPGEIRLPSPRLVALDGNGQPAPEFFALLETAVLAYARPQPLRFAVPAEQVRVYSDLAAQYNAQVDTAVALVEVVSLADLPPDPAVWLREVDGALFTPTPALITSGHIRDLTPLVQGSSNAEFKGEDFYEQLWLAGEWQERLWMLPHTAVQPILYYDPTAYTTLQRTQPNTIWTWERLQEDILTFYAQPEWAWGLVATDFSDLAYGYAFTHGACPPPEPTVNCYPHLLAEDITAGQQFLANLEPGLPNLAGMSPTERTFFFQNQVSSSTRQAPLWLDAPALFEHHSQSRQALLAPWPGVVPLRVAGMVVSQHSAHPTAVWHWLTYLSYQYPERTTRHIPARLSVANEVNFWRGLPSPLGRVMQASFTRARPIRLDEQDALGE
ncbi:MAG: hypothetical protein KDD89_08505 [Anaerolineales bacterium]|nr:hypothetical protein [Anaerolineales bacterium]